MWYNFVGSFPNESDVKAMSFEIVSCTVGK